jgi:hypothetical protein
MKRVNLTILLVLIMPSFVFAQSTLALQEKCAGGAKKLLLEIGDCLPVTSGKEYLTFCEYISHYNKKLDKCFLRFDSKTTWNRTAPEQLRGRTDITIQVIDVFEHKMIGEFYTGLYSGNSKVNGKQCRSLTEFEILIKPYLEE